MTKQWKPARTFLDYELATVLVISLSCLMFSSKAMATCQNDTLPSVSQRFAENSQEVPDFQRHISPLFGRLGCNGRACHGSFQGKGGFQLSLFGYDFAADHRALMAEGSGRVDQSDVVESLLLSKPIDSDNHGGGKRFAPDSWQYRLLAQWIALGAKGTEQPSKLIRLELTPSEMVYAGQDAISIQAVAVWPDGSREDVTPLCRFQSKDPAVAEVNEFGQVTFGKSGDTHVIVFYDNAVVPLPVLRPYSTSSPAESLTKVNTRSNAIQNAPNKPVTLDQCVQWKLDKLGLDRSELADDVTFLRRVSLDLCGTLPTPSEVEAFVADTDPEKRARKIEELLTTPAYAAYWTTFFCDITGNNSGELRDVSVGSDFASRLWYDWIYERVEQNVPYDEMVAGIVLGRNREPGESYQANCDQMSWMRSNEDSEPFVSRSTMPLYWMRRETQTPGTRAISFAHAFLGVQIQCAECHKHPFDRWTKEDFDQFSRFFSGVEFARGRPRSTEDREDYSRIMEALGINERSRGGNLQKMVVDAARAGKTIPLPMLYVTKPKVPRNPEGSKPKNGKQVRQPLYYSEARLLGDEPISLEDTEDVRGFLIDWLRSSKNPYFAKALVNRVWAIYFGTGLVNPIDDLSLANPPSNPELFEYLANGLVESGYDLKWLHRQIANSRTYQTSWVPKETNAGDRRNFSRAIPRRLSAEVIVDACRQATSRATVSAQFREEISDRAIAISGTILGRNGGRSRNPQFALEAFGRSTRDNNCDCDRSNEVNLIQTVYMQNDQDIHYLLGRADGWISDIRKSFGPDTLESRPTRDQIAQRIAKMQRQRDDAEKAGNERGVRQLETKIKDFEKRIAEIESQTQIEPDVSNDDRIGWIQEAYLRTLSRPPTPDEIATCQKYFAESKDPISGLTGVMWALLNHKEFLVNH